MPTDWLDNFDKFYGFREAPKLTTPSFGLSTRFNDNYYAPLKQKPFGNSWSSTNSLLIHFEEKDSSSSSQYLDQLDFQDHFNDIPNIGENLPASESSQLIPVKKPSFDFNSFVNFDDDDDDGKNFEPDQPQKQMNLEKTSKTMFLDGNNNDGGFFSDEPNETDNKNKKTKQQIKFLVRKIVGRNIGYYERFGWNFFDDSMQKEITLRQELLTISLQIKDEKLDKQSTLQANSPLSTSFNDENVTNVRQTKSYFQNKKMECSFCKNLQSEFINNNYKSHWLKDNQKRIICPILRAYKCPICNNHGGDNAHTIRYCPQKREKLAKDFQRSVEQQQIKNLIKKINEQQIKLKVY